MRSMNASWLRRILGGVAALLLGLSAAARAQNMRLGEVLIFNVPDLKRDADVKAFEAHVLGEVIPAWKASATGMELHLVQKDRGNRPGKYLFAYTGGMAAYGRIQAPGASAGSPFTADLLEKAGVVGPGLARFINSGGEYIEYRLVAPEKVGVLPEVDVLGIHYIKVRPDRREAFDRFIAEKLHPSVGNLRPDLRLLYYRPVRGTDVGNYLTLIALTQASRDKYWPGGKDSEDLKTAFKTVDGLAEELKAYLVEGSYTTGNLAAAVYESREWADWVQVRAENR